MALLETFRDNFNHNSNSPDWNTFQSNDGTQANVANSRAEITHNTGPQYNTLESNSSFDATSNAVLVQVTNVGNQSLVSHEVIFYLGTGTANKVWMTASANVLMAWKQVAGVNTQVGSSIAYSSSAHAWWQIREAGGTTYWETCPDGRSWTTRWSALNPITMTALFIGLQTGCWQAEASGSFAYFDNLNSAPEAKYLPTRIPNR